MRKKIDWEAIEKEYRLGQKSLRTIADQFKISHTAIRKRANKEKWIQDKSKEVRELTRAALVSRKVATVTREDIDLAVQTNIAVITNHRNDARTQASLLDRLTKEIERRTQNIQDVPFKDLQACFGMLRDSSMALLKLTQIERQAFNIDNDPRRGETIEEIAIEVIRTAIEAESSTT